MNGHEFPWNCAGNCAANYAAVPYSPAGPRRSLIRLLPLDHADNSHIRAKTGHCGLTQGVPCGNLSFLLVTLVTAGKTAGQGMFSAGDRRW